MASIKRYLHQVEEKEKQEYLDGGCSKEDADLYAHDVLRYHQDDLQELRSLEIDLARLKGETPML